MAAFCTQLGSYGAAFNHNHLIHQCPNVLLQEGGQEPCLREPQLSQRGKLGQGGPGHDPGHGRNSGVGRGGEQAIETPLAECEFEQVCEVADLVESWADRPTMGVSDQPWSLTSVHNVVVQPGTTQSVTVR